MSISGLPGGAGIAGLAVAAEIVAELPPLRLAIDLRLQDGTASASWLASDGRTGIAAGPPEEVAAALAAVVMRCLDKVIDRASTNSEDLILNSKNSRFASGVTAEHMDLAGFDYSFAKGLTGRYYYADVEDIYRQHFLGLLASQPLGGGTLSADLRLSISDDSGSAKAGKVDNNAWNGLLSYAHSGHKVGLGYQHLTGDTGFAYLDGSDPFLVNFVQINDFANADERSWQARYDFDFAGLGVPGLSFMTRYVKGDNSQVSGSDEEGREWERNIEFKYVVQSGPLKDLYVRLRNASFRSSFARDADENRLIVGYSLPIW